ncbi:MAG: hypothetical protein JNN30_22275 [Rhodanobacteraceae bacterium]|nr:hypothetical protein [Rhodanobacteraceae bacterium]
MRPIAFVMPLAAALFALPVAAQVVCDPVLDNVACPQGSVNKYCPVVLNANCSTGKAQIVLASTEPPPAEHTQIQCVLDPGLGYYCEAWPQFGGVTYQWSVRGDMYLGGANNLSSAQISCTYSLRNSITVVVTSPYGLSTIATVQAPCGDSDIVQW